MSVDEAPPAPDARVAFAAKRRDVVETALEEMSLETWTPLSDVVFGVADRTDLSRALVVEALFDIVEGGEYAYRMTKGEPAVKHEGR